MKGPSGWTPLLIVGLPPEWNYPSFTKLTTTTGIFVLFSRRLKEVVKRTWERKKLVHELQELRQRIAALEESVAGSNKRQVGIAGDTLSFKNNLKYVLRHDPDVILVGGGED